MYIVKPDTRYPFIAKRKPFLLVSGVLVAIAFALPFILGPNWGISFSGGTSIILHFEEPVEANEVRQAFESMGFEGSSVQTFGAGDGQDYIVKTKEFDAIDDGEAAELVDPIPAKLVAQGVEAAELKAEPSVSGNRIFFGIKPVVSEDELRKQYEDDPETAQTLMLDPTQDILSGVTLAQIEDTLKDVKKKHTVTFDPLNREFVIELQEQQAEILDGLEERFGAKFKRENGISQIVSVGAEVGAKFRNDGILAILISLGLILLYITIRFDIRYAPGAVAALAHDVILTFGVLTILQWEISLETVAALLTIVGYSLNDTIVTFDRVRENLADKRRVDEGLPETVNRSINECLSRTVLTSVTTAIAILFLALFGGGLISDFAWTMLMGVIVGTYSSIFVASPFMLFMDGFLERRKKRLEERTKLTEASAAVSE